MFMIMTDKPEGFYIRNLENGMNVTLPENKPLFFDKARDAKDVIRDIENGHISLTHQ